jgi:hypothetical protein
MDPAQLRALLAAHPAVGIVPFHGRPGVRCVRAQDAARLVRDAGLDADDAQIEAAMAELGGARLRLVDPAAQEDAPARRARPRRGRTAPVPKRRPRKGPPLEDLDVYELPASIFGG